MKEGIYRLNVTPGGRSELLVYEGLAESAGGEIKEGREAVSQGAGAAVSPIDKKARDGFDVWSRKRAEVLLASSRSVRASLIDHKLNRAHYGGMLFLDQESGQYTFVPGYWSFHSPYGGEYSIKFERLRIFLPPTPSPRINRRP